MKSTEQAEQRYQHLFDRHHREVYAYCRRRVDAETAADCASDTFVVAWRRIDDVPEGEAARWWLYEVARRTLANEYRSLRRRRGLLTRLRGQQPDPDPSPELVVVRRERDEKVLSALARLSTRDRELLQMALWDEVPHAAIAALLGCSTQAVTQRVYRATRRAAREYRRIEYRHGVGEVSEQLRGGETR